MALRIRRSSRAEGQAPPISFVILQKWRDLEDFLEAATAPADARDFGATNERLRVFNYACVLQRVSLGSRRSPLASFAVGFYECRADV